MEFSQRIAALKPSPTVALNSKAKELTRQGKTVFNFSVGEPDFPTPEEITAVGIEALRQGKTKYAPAGGSPALREAVCEKLKRDNQLEFDANQIVMGIGAKELLFHCKLALLNEGDEVLIPAPYWVSYTAQVEAAGAKPVVIPMSEDLSAAPVSPESVEPYITEKTKAIVITSPSNPTGAMLSAEQLRHLGEYLLDKDIWVISDEIYEYMAFDLPHHSMLQLVPELRDRFVLVNGLSKGFAMTGWRVGFLAAPLALAKLVKTLQTQSSTCLPPFVEEAAIYALKQGPSLMQEKMEILKKRRRIATSLLDEMPGVDYIPPKGAFYIFVDIRQALETAGWAPHDSMAFGAKLLDEYSVAMVPGEAFGAPGFLRLSYATNEADLESGLKLLAQALKELKK